MAKKEGCPAGTGFNPRTKKCEEYLLENNDLAVFKGDTVVAVDDLYPIGWIGENEYVKPGDKFTVTGFAGNENLLLTGIADYRGGLPAKGFSRIRVSDIEKKRIEKELAEYFAEQGIPIEFTIDGFGIPHRMY